MRLTEISKGNKEAGVGITLLLLASSLLFLHIPSQAEFDNSDCLACHDQSARNLMATKHRLDPEGSGASEGISCVSCHDGAAEHLDFPEPDNIVNPGRLDGPAQESICSDCHVAHVELDNYGFDAHNIAELACTDCHSIHGGKQALLLDNRTEFCITCHEDQAGSFHRESNHPVAGANLTCLDCHSFARRAEDNLAYESGSVCRKCHPAQAGPFIFEHEPNTAFAIDGGGCLDCHSPHGSPNDRLLNQPRENLCRQCHGTPPGHINNQVHGYVWSQYDDCTLCHSQVHGSNDNRLYLDPNLPARFGEDCFRSGCHAQNWQGGQ